MLQLGAGELGVAQGYLETAAFLDNRPFYFGMTNLWLGKLFDSRGNHQKAQEYYSEVLTGASAAYHQKEARFLIDNPFGN